jgi:hypothetical protein
VKPSKRVLYFLLLCVIALSSIAVLDTRAQAKKFHLGAESKFNKACGSGLDEHSACSGCGYVVGIPFTTGATCGHVCVTLPSGKTEKDVVLHPYATEDPNAGGPPTGFQPCGTGQAQTICAIQWSHFETTEFYPNTGQLCGRFKNWSSDRDRWFRIEVDEK